MKIYKQEKAIILTGKAWQVRHMLKTYHKDYIYIRDWIKGEKTQPEKEDKF